MDVRDLNVDMQDLAYNPVQTSGRINNPGLSTEKSGLKDQKISYHFPLRRKTIVLKICTCKHHNSILQDQVQVGTGPLDDISNHLGDLRVNANLKNSRVGLRDVLILMPSFASMEPFKSSPNAAFKITGKVNGQVNNRSA